jgi:hypothetical protein
MKRVATSVVFGFSVMMLTAVAAPGGARADCGDEAKAIRVKLSDVKEEARRDELTRLIDKAQKDADAGRLRSCVATLKYARALLR